eukprot:2557934-Pleurochrysis_carterae.AAC.1
MTSPPAPQAEVAPLSTASPARRATQTVRHVTRLPERDTVSHADRVSGQAATALRTSDVPTCYI